MAAIGHKADVMKTHGGTRAGKNTVRETQSELEGDAVGPLAAAPLVGETDYPWVFSQPPL